MSSHVQPLECAAQRRQAWEILCDLSSFTSASFDAVKLLRSQRFVDDEVYAIVRRSLCFEEPLKTRVTNLLKRVVQYRKMTWPCHQASLSLPFLSHASVVRTPRRSSHQKPSSLLMLGGFLINGGAFMDSLQQLRCLFLQEQWDMHEQCVLRVYRLDWKRVQNSKKALQGLVVHCEDHHPNHLMAFCPQIYFASVSGTWADPLVFQELNTDAVALKIWVLEQIPKQLKSRYPWGVDASGSLPVGLSC